VCNSDVARCVYRFPAQLQAGTGQGDAAINKALTVLGAVTTLSTALLQFTAKGDTIHGKGDNITAIVVNVAPHQHYDCYDLELCHVVCEPLIELRSNLSMENLPTSRHQIIADCSAVSWPSSEANQYLFKQRVELIMDPSLLLWRTFV
jgi:hypothetical protein